MKSSNRRLLARLLRVACASLSAQEFRALISGIVQDPTGSAIPGATVRIKNVGTNLAVTVQSGPDGARREHVAVQDHSDSGAGEAGVPAGRLQRGEQQDLRQNDAIQPL